MAQRNTKKQQPEVEKPEVDAPKDENPKVDEPKVEEPKETEVLKVVASVDLFEPFLAIKLPAGQQVEVPRITGWMRSQIDANLLAKV